MKKLILSGLLLFLVGFSYCQNLPTASDFSKLSWIGGTWTRTNAKPGRSGTEIWTSVSANEWRGLGINMKGADTTFVEKLKLIAKDGNLYYVADVPENSTLVYFKFTEISTSHFVCENPQHDFPKKIEYRKEGASMKAIISGDGKAVEYLFMK